MKRLSILRQGLSVNSIGRKRENKQEKVGVGAGFKPKLAPPVRSSVDLQKFGQRENRPAGLYSSKHLKEWGNCRSASPWTHFDCEKKEEPGKKVSHWSSTSEVGRLVFPFCFCCQGRLKSSPSLSTWIEVKFLEILEEFVESKARDGNLFKSRRSRY